MKYAASLLLAFSLAVGPCMSAMAEEPLEVTFAGSSTIMPVMEALEDYLADNGVKASIQGGGSSAGIRAVRSGMADIGMVSRSLSDSEAEILDGYTLAHDIITIIVHADNPVSNIDADRVGAIYRGEQEKWRHGGNINPIGKENGRATKVAFESHFGLVGQVRPDAVIIGSNGQAISAVGSDPRAIAYVSYASAHQAARNGAPIRILALNGIKPNMDSAESGEYPLRRDLNLVYSPDSSELAQRIVRLLSKPEAADIIRAQFVVPSRSE